MRGARRGGPVTVLPEPCQRRLEGADGVLLHPSLQHRLSQTQKQLAALRRDGKPQMLHVFEQIEPSLIMTDGLFRRRGAQGSFGGQLDVADAAFAVAAARKVKGQIAQLLCISSLATRFEGAANKAV